MKQQPSRLQRELKQVRPFRSRSTELILAITRTADSLQRHTTDLLAPHGVTSQQYNVLRILRGARGEPMATLDIADRLIQRTPGITRLLDRLEEKRLVRRERGTDRRQVHCFITEAGLELLASLDDPIDRFDDMAIGLVTARDMAKAIAVLERIREKLDG